MAQTNGHNATIDLHRLATARFERSMVVPEAFLTAEANRIAEACWAMARRFHQGGRLITFGNGFWASDAQHVSVEFVHPVIVGKRALPAISLTNDSVLLGLPFTRQLLTLARPQDIALGFAHSDQDEDDHVVLALCQAQAMGLLTLGLTGGGGGGGRLAAVGLDFCFCVMDDDLLVVQETHETLYHILWELVHVFFEHEGMLV